MMPTEEDQQSERPGNFESDPNDSVREYLRAIGQQRVNN